MSFEGYTPTCPACKAEAVEELEDRGVPFLGCTQCFGLFTSDDQLARYAAESTGSPEVGQAFTQLLQSALDKPARPGNRTCPVCRLPLARLGFGEAPFVVLDRCPGHGLWLDKRELKKVVRSSRAHAAVLGLVPRFHDDEEDED